MLLDYQVSQTSRKFESFQDFLELILAALCLLPCGFSLVAASRGYARVGCVGFSRGAQARGLGSCGSWALELGLGSCGAWVLLLCSMWDLPVEGLNPCPLHWQENS